MPVPRIYLPQPLQPGQACDLDERAHRHVSTVLRLRAGDDIILFNGEGGEYSARLTTSHRQAASAEIQSFNPREVESTLEIHLLQGVARGEKMDLIIQKAVELGVRRIVPVMTERSQIKLSGERLQKRLEHWRGVIIHACEQCGRNRLPELNTVQSLAECLAEQDSAVQGLILDPYSEHSLSSCGRHSAYRLLIGPEGGLSKTERLAATSAGFSGIRLGPRILRTETAALTAMAALQSLYGDLNR